MTTFSEISPLLEGQAIEVPSWAYGNSGTRFKVFGTPGTPRTVEEKIADAATVHEPRERTPLRLVLRLDRTRRSGAEELARRLMVHEANGGAAPADLVPAGEEGRGDPPHPRTGIEHPRPPGQQRVRQPGLAVDVGSVRDQLGEPRRIAPLLGSGQLPAGAGSPRGFLTRHR